MPKKIPPRIIRIKVESTNKKELKSLAKDLGVLNKSVKQTAKNTKFLANAFKFSFLGFGIREVVRLNDQFNLLRDRISVFTGDARSANQVFQALAKDARETRTSVTSLAESYNRIALATQELGLSQKDILGVTRALQQTFRLSGATIAEATAATIQLSQGLSSGQLRGQELRSVLEQNAVFVNILSKELGVARGQLIKFAESGGITSEVVLAGLRKNFQKLEEDASKLGTTIQQGLTAAFDSFVLTLNRVDQAGSITRTLADGLIVLAENMETVIAAVAILAGAKGIASIITLVKELNLVLVSGAALKFVRSLSPLTVAITAIAGAGIAGVKSLQAFAKANRGLGKQALFTLQRQRDEQLKLIRDKEKELAIAKNFEKLNIAGGRTRAADIERKGAKELQRELDVLNKKYNELETSILGYNRALGTSNKIKKKTANELAILNARLKSGKITFEEYSNALNTMTIANLNKDFKDGKINVLEYIAALEKIPGAAKPSQTAILALDNAIKAQSETLGIAQGIFTKTFQGIEDAMVEFATNGKFVWRDFVNVIIKEIIRLAIRATVIRPILQAISGFSFGSNAATGAALPTSEFSASAFLPGGNVAFSAKGNVFDKPGLSVFGEAGPEAILPLTRGSGGELGVKAVGGSGGGETIINVFNNGDNQVETKETTGPNGEKQIDIMIASKVKGLFQSGAMDRQMSANYGLKRKGT